MLLAVSWYYRFTETTSGDTIVFARSGWSTALLFAVLAFWLAVGGWLCRKGLRRAAGEKPAAFRLVIGVVLVAVCLYAGWVNVRMMDDRCEVTPDRLNVQEYAETREIAYDDVRRIEWYPTTAGGGRRLSSRRIANVLITLKSGETVHLTGDMVDAASRKAAARMIDSGRLSRGDILDREKQGLPPGQP